MTMPVRPGVLCVGTIVYLVGDDGAATVQADYPDLATAQAQATSLAEDNQLDVLDPASYMLYALSNRPVPRSGMMPPPHPVSRNHPSQRGNANG